MRSKAKGEVSRISRSENMRRIRSKDTGPELAVRKLLRNLGFTGYRLHRKDLPGKPDIAFIGRKKAVLIHGCFWHGHDCKEGLRKPKSNQDYWLPKIERNQQRDAQHLAELERLGWSVLTVWECELHSPPNLAERLQRFVTAVPA
jgi:DNA mismatch endonuclease (patch repair protein)